MKEREKQEKEKNEDKKRNQSDFTCNQSCSPLFKNEGYYSKKSNKAIKATPKITDTS